MSKPAHHGRDQCQEGKHASSPGRQWEITLQTGHSPDRVSHREGIRVLVKSFPTRTALPPNVIHLNSGLLLQSSGCSGSSCGVVPGVSLEVCDSGVAFIRLLSRLPAAFSAPSSLPSVLRAPAPPLGLAFPLGPPHSG